MSLNGNMKNLQKTGGYMSKVVALAFKKTGISIYDIRSKTRKKEVVHARYIICWLAYRYSNLSLNRIGKIIGKDHSTVLHAVATWVLWYNVYDDTRELIDELEKEISLTRIERDNDLTRDFDAQRKDAVPGDKAA